MMHLVIPPEYAVVQKQLERYSCNEAGIRKQIVVVPKLQLGGVRTVVLGNFSFPVPGAQQGVIVFDACAGDAFKHLIDAGVSRERLMLAGVRSWQDKQFFDQARIRYFTMQQIFSMGCQDVCDTIMENARGWKDVQVRIHMGVTDPAFSPANLGGEPGGLTGRELLYFMQRLAFLQHLSLVFIYGTDLARDVNSITAQLIAKMILELQPRNLTQSFK
ncbi:arginase family protein [Candidatus Woesearchaeota archaeon]|nr:arginase family protein [Candidatus Woesearchaeota archaeon]